MADCCLIKKVATVEVYENKNEVRAYGFMAGDRNTPVMEVRFKHLWGESNLSTCKLRWIIVDDVGSLLVGEVPIQSDNTALINLPNELFTGDRRMKVQLTVASCDGDRILNLQQFTDLRVANSLAPNEVVEPVYQILINQLYDETQKYLSQLDTLYTSQYGSLENLYVGARASLEQYLITAENGGNAEFLQGYVPSDFQKVEDTINNLINSAKYKVGNVVEVLGYYAKGDGLHHKLIIGEKNLGNAIELQNGLYANPVPNSYGVNKTDIQDVKDELIVARNEIITPERIQANSIPSRKLSITTDDDKIKMVNLSEEVKAAMSGTTPIAPDLPDKSVTYEKLSFETLRLNVSENLFDVNKITRERYVGADGNLVYNKDYVSSEYIEVEQNKKYSFTKLHNCAFYDIDKNFISTHTGGEGLEVISPTGASVARFSVLEADCKKCMFVLGEVFPKKLLEKNVIKKENIPILQGDDVGFEILDVFPTKNLFDKTKITRDRYLNTSSGKPVISSAGYNVSDFIEIDSAKKYIFNNMQFGGAFYYSVDKAFISFTDGNLVSPPINARYIRFTVHNDKVDICQVEEGVVSTVYESFGKKILASSIRGDYRSAESKLTVFTVAKSGGMFTKVSDALNSITNASENNRYLIKVSNGIYEDTFRTKHWVDIEGQDKYKTIITYTGDVATWIDTSTVFLETQTKISNMTIVGTDTKYPMHVDKATGAWTAEIDNVVMLHKGSLTDNTKAGTPIGIGLYKNQHLIVRNSEMRQETRVFGASGLYVHNQISSIGTDYRSLRVENCKLLNVTYGWRVDTLEGSEGQDNDIFFNNNEIVAVNEKLHQGNMNVWHIYETGNNFIVG